jgi:hypothetical protein
MIRREMTGFTGAKVGDFDRKVRRRSRGREGFVDLCGCIVYVSCGYAEVIRLEMLFSMGFRRCREFAVPGLFETSVCFVRIVSSSKLGRHSFGRPLLGTARFYAEGPLVYASAHRDKKLPAD